MQEREIPFWETITNRKDASTRKNMYYLALSIFKLKTGKKPLMLRQFGSCKHLPKGVKKVESNQPRPYCLVCGSVGL